MHGDGGSVCSASSLPSSISSKSMDSRLRAADLAASGVSGGRNYIAFGTGGAPGGHRANLTGYRYQHQQTQQTQQQYLQQQQLLKQHAQQQQQQAQRFDAGRRSLVGGGAGMALRGSGTVPSGNFRFNEDGGNNTHQDVPASTTSPFYSVPSVQGTSDGASHCLSIDADLMQSFPPPPSRSHTFKSATFGGELGSDQSDGTTSVASNSVRDRTVSSNCSRASNSSRQSGASVTDGPNIAVFRNIEEDFRHVVVGEDDSVAAARRVLQLCFSAFAVVFVETCLPKRKSSQSASATMKPIRYARMGNVDAGVARMLWEAILGRDNLDDYDWELQQNPDAWQDQQQQVDGDEHNVDTLHRDAAITNKDLLSFFNEIDNWESSVTAGGVGSLYFLNQSLDLHAATGGGGRRDSSLTTPESSSCLWETADGRKQRSSWMLRRSRKDNNDNHMSASSTSTASRWLGRGSIFRRSSAGPKTTNKGELFSGDDSSTLPTTSSMETDRTSMTSAMLAARRASLPNPSRHLGDPLRGYVLDMLSQVGVLEVTDLWEDEDSDDELLDAQRLLEEEEEEEDLDPAKDDEGREFLGHRSGTSDQVSKVLDDATDDRSHDFGRGDVSVDMLGFNDGYDDGADHKSPRDDDVDDCNADDDDDDEDDDDDAESTDFMGWAAPSASKKERKRKLTQHVRVHREIHYQFGLYLSALPRESGGFALSIASLEEQGGNRVDDYDEHGGGMLPEFDNDNDPEALDRATTAGEGETLRRWNEAMARACMRKRTRNPARRFTSREGAGADNLLVAFPSRSFSLENNNSSGAFLTTQPSASAAGNVVDAAEKQDRPWIFENVDRWPLDEPTLYALRMLPTHLMRAGLMEDAADYLRSPNFFLGRLKALGAEEATLKHRQDIDEMEYRVAFTQRKQMEQEENVREGFTHNLEDRSSSMVDVKAMMLAATGVMTGALTESYASIVLADSGKEKVKGEVHKGETGNALHSIAWYIAKKGSVEEAIACYKKSLRFKRASYGSDHVTLADTLHNLGNLHRERQAYGDAISCYERALKIFRDKIDCGHMKIGSTLSSMGMAHGLSGNFDKAAECYYEALSIERANLGDSTLQVAGTFLNLGVIHGITGAYLQAVQCYEETLRIKKLRLGKDNEECADVLINLGMMRCKMGEFAKAVDCYQEALEITQEKTGEDHIEVARVLYCLGIAYNAMGQLDLAVKSYEGSLHIRLFRLGDDHEDVALTLHNLGVVFHKRGDNDRAMECLKGAQRVRKRSEYAMPEKTADTLHAMGLVFQKQGDRQQAMECYLDALKIRRERLGNDHLDVACTLHNLGDVEYMRNELEKAMNCYEGAFRIRFFKLGTDHIDVAATRNNMGVVHLKRGENDTAMECFKEALRVREMKLGSDHEKCGDTMHNMGLVHKNLMQYDQAIVRYEQALKVRKARLGQSDMKVADTLYNLAIVYANSARYATALENYKEALRTYRETGLSDDHPSVANTLQWIKWTQKQLK